MDTNNLTHELERYRDAGLGGVHIIPIYGTKGYEAKNIPYLSPKWIEMLPEAELAIIFGMTNGLIRVGPPSR